MRYWRRLLTVGLSVLSLLALSFTAITINAGAATLPTTINEVVSVGGTLTDPGCPSFSRCDPDANGVQQHHRGHRSSNGRQHDLRLRR
jgi:hypothetical protein